jgi:uncharacterized DUF497 family protein
MSLVVEWDPAKEMANRRKHGISFDEAASVLLDPISMTIRDPDHSRGEERYLDLGMSSRGRLLVLSYTERGKRIRIISAREASPKEIRDYEKGHD